MACNIISGTIIVGISIFYFFFGLWCEDKGFFFSGTFLRVLVSGSKIFRGFYTHVRLIVRRETCVTISDDGKVELWQQCNAGKGRSSYFCTSFGDVTGRRSGFFLSSFSQHNGRKPPPKKKDRKKRKKKDLSGWTAISSWFDIKGFGVVSFEGRDFSLGLELGSFFYILFFLCSHSSQQGKLRDLCYFFFF